MADTALKTFQAAISRAEYLLKLHNGLAGQTEFVLSDQPAKDSCVLTAWQEQATIGGFRNAEVALLTRQGGKLAFADFDDERLSDLLRASLVMGVSALDAYFHSKVIAHIVKAVNGKDGMPAALARKHITVKDFVDSKRYKRRMTAVRNAVQRSLGYQSLQKPDRIAESLGLIGVSKLWGSVAKRMKRKQENVKRKLTKIARRRNRIAHEGDVSQSKKHRNKPHKLTQRDVEVAMRFLALVAQAAEDEINSQLGI
jgi:hypothetical protein